MKQSIFILCISLFAFQLNSQTAADYDFAQISAIYPVISGTVTITNIIANSDETITLAIYLPFSFTYCGVVYNNMRISSNGFISPGNTLAQSAFTNDLAGTIKPVIAPLWDDLAAGTAGNVVYTTEGTSPNRVFIVEFRNFKWIYASTTENRHFQVRLYENTNIIEFYYNIVDAPSGNYIGASIGISDATGGIGHFISVSPSSSSTISSSVSNNSINSAQFLNGVKYRFSPSSCPAPHTFMASNITNNSATLIWINSAITHLKYDIIPFDPNTQGILISNATNPYYATGLVPNSTYYFYLKADCGGLTSNWAGPFTFNTLCNPVSAFPIIVGFNTAVPPACWTENIIASIGTPPDWYYTTSGINPAVAPFEGTAMAGFNSFDCYSGSQARLASSFIVFPAQHPIQMSYMMYHDNYYNYQTEGIQVQVSTDGTNWVNEGPLNLRYSTTVGWEQEILNLSAYAGQSIRIAFLATSQFGNNMFIDDVVIEEISNCLPPLSVTISGIGDTYAQASWQAAPGTDFWHYEVGLQGFSPGTGNSVINSFTSSTSAALTQLNPNTVYHFYIQTDCDTSGVSSWAGPFSFITDCSPITAFPWTESFENSGQLPQCWTVNHNALYTGFANWQMVTSDTYGASSGYNGSGYFARLNTSVAPTNGNAYNLNSVPIYIPAAYYNLYYYFWIKNGNANPNPIIVKVSADNGATWSTLYSHTNIITNTWTQQSISLQPYSQQTILIRFEGYSNYTTTGNLGIDQVEIKAIKALTFSNYCFNESTNNDGSIQNSIDLKLIGETFSNTGVLFEGLHYTTANIPAGLTAVVEVFSSDSARFTLSGNATNHSNINDIANLKLEFKNFAFTGNNASSIFSYLVDTIKVDFRDFLVINEADADQTGSDLYEFIELYDGGTGNYPLDGYCIVLYNGSTDLVYNSYDLDGNSTNAEGYFVMGTPNIPSASLLFAGNTLQNGQDAIALYEGNAGDFPVGSSLQYNKLIDAVVYDNGQADDTELLTLIVPGEPQVNENEYNMGPVYSFQRIPNGSGGMKHTYTYATAPPTPGTMNSPAPILTWSADTFYESLADDGSIETIINLTLQNDIFAFTGQFQENVHYSAQNVPSGLEFNLEAITDTTLELSLVGNALLHSPPDDIYNLTLNLLDAAFSGYTSPLIVKASRNNLYVSFIYPVNIIQSEALSFKVYPNPADKKIVIETNISCKGSTLLMYDISGRILIEDIIFNNKNELDISRFLPGIYLLKIQSEQLVFIKR